MKEKIKAIEKILQYFFEEQLQNLGGKDIIKNVTDGVIDVISENINSSEDKKYIPNIFRISLKKQEDLSKKNIKSWGNILKEIIKENAQIEGYSLTGPLHIQFFNDSKIPSDYQIDIAFSSAQSGKTVSILTNGNNGEQTDKKVRGFLITPTEHNFALENKITNIGRKEGNDLVIDNFLVSRLHAQIREINGKHVIFDFDSAGGTKINGNRISQHPLSSGDIIEIADVSLIYYADLNEELSGHNSGITKPI